MSIQCFHSCPINKINKAIFFITGNTLTLNRYNILKPVSVHQLVDGKTLQHFVQHGEVNQRMSFSCVLGHDGVLYQSAPLLLQLTLATSY